MIEEADTIRSFLIDGDHPVMPLFHGDSVIWLGDSLIYQWKIIKAGPALDASQTRRLRKAVLSRHTYVFNDSKGCLPRPGLGLRFIHDGHRVDLALCFECLMWSFYSDGEVHDEDFDGSARELRELAHELFPDVEKFTRLGPQRGFVQLAGASLPAGGQAPSIPLHIDPMWMDVGE